MLILQLLIFSFSSSCPEGTPYLYNEEFDVEIKKNQWYYFHTNIQIENHVPMLVIAVKSDKPVSLYSTNAFECPDGSDPPFLNVSSHSRFIRGNNYYHSSNGIISVGIKAIETAHVFIRLEGQSKLRSSKKYIIKLALTFLIMMVITVFLFVYVILPNEMKEKEKKENEKDLFKIDY